MRSRTARSCALALSLVALAAAPACKQGEGQRCEIDSDCEDGLICSPGPGGQSVCVPDTSGTPVDAAPKPMPDASADAAPSDAAPPDAGVDAAPPDAAPPDAAPPDAGTPDAQAAE
ncbi:MAG: hypothetical protein D6689_13800 [Deltaproteobacteria bacterium]|nr:MAG: hypothetical protein D6689_13800 [Deltaproteobacteria bacterium]